MWLMKVAQKVQSAEERVAVGYMAMALSEPIFVTFTLLGLPL